MTHSDREIPADRASGGARTIVEVLQRRCQEHGDRTVFTFLPHASSPRSLTFGDLDRRARAIASRLADEPLRGERALLLYPAGTDFIEAFLGCLCAGVIAVPAYPPRAGKTLGRLAAIAADSGARAVLVPAAVLSRWRAIASADPALASLRWIATDETPDAAGEGFIPFEAETGSIAYLQYTSGSTSEPKGVMIGHENLLANSEDIRTGFGHDRTSRSLTWLPHFHDMGLVDGLLQPVYSGFHAVLMDPTGFLQNPARWMEAITAHGITHTGAPNFAYDLCTRRVEPDPSRFDLRSWAVAYNGAEPVQAETLERFASRFESCGFRREAFYPAYGLAEATLKVSGPARCAGARILRVERSDLEAGRVREAADGVPLVGSGPASGGTRIGIVDPITGRERPDGEVGEIWVSGPGVALGYWNRPEETRSTFEAALPDDPARFLRTGDLGFLHGGDLFVTGRVKDLIIVRGRNIYPQDVESTAATCDPALRPSGGAAFGVDRQGTQRLVLVHEVERHGISDPDAVIAAMRRAVVETHEIDPEAVVLVRHGGVPRTTSGKVRRAACRKAYLEGTLPVVAFWRAAEPTAERRSLQDAAHDPEAWLRAAVASRIGVEAGSIRLDLPAVHLGMDSMRAIELAHEIEEVFGVTLQATELLAAQSLSEIVPRLEVRRGIPPRRPGLDSGPEPEEAALSAGQKALLYLHELEPGGSAYTIAAALRLEGPLDEDLLERTLRAVVARHASLRARIVRSPAGFRQSFDVPTEAIVTRGDLRGLAGDRLSHALADEAYRPFDLERGPLFRATIFRVDSGRVLLTSAHHAVADLWSLSVVLDDLMRLYGAALGADPPASERVPHPSEFVRWQEEMLGGDIAEKQFSYWSERLSGDLPGLDLPADKPRPQARTFHGSALWKRLDSSLASRLRDLARARGVTMHTLLLAAFQAFLSRITGQRDVVVGTPASGRTVPRFSGLVGYLVNTVVLRADLSEDPTFDALLDATRRRVHEALECQDYPFSTLVKRLGVARDPGRSPLFDVMFDFHAAGDRVRGDLSMPHGGARVEIAGGITAGAIAVDRRASQFDLSLTVMDDGAGLVLELEYSTDLFERKRVEEIAGCFEALLAAAAADPSARVSRVPILSKDGREAALTAANARPALDPLPPVHRLFEREAARQPASAAAWLDGRRLTYGELNRRANVLARRLQRLGVGPESRVAVCLEKSFELLIAFMGVLKAGGAYVPIVPSLPASRRGFLLADSGATVMIAGGDREPEEPDASFEGVRVIRLDRDGWTDEPPREEAGENLEEEAFQENLAYIIYTSGTTGTPKGVGITHASLGSAFRAWEAAYDIRSLGTHLQMASPGFDVFTADMVRALCAGGALVLCPRETLLDPPALSALARRHCVDYAEFVPAALRELASHLARTGSRLEGVRLVVVGSDAWSMADHAQFREAFAPDTRIFNSYGVTEATIDSTAGDAGGGPSHRPSPTIGIPLGNTALHVLDGNLEPVPEMVLGEIYVGGPAVGRGYIGRPDLTADRFVPDPHGPPGSRLYRTGDLARRLPAGRLEFVGRADSQVKVRGYRIEPAEIEAVLETHPSVRACAVAAREHGSDRRLAAYVALEGDLPDPATALRAHAAARLPDYMIPSAIMVLPSLPLSPNGKIDRRALPDPQWVAVAEDPASEPATPTELRLAQVWQSVLGIPRAGRTENFFALGGDSILSIQVVARAREAGLHVTPRMLFEHPTIADLALACAPGEAGSTGAAWSGEAVLLPIQRWFFEQEFDGIDHWNIAVALDAREALDPDCARRACSALLDHHDALRSRFLRERSGWRQTVEAPGAVDPFLVLEDVRPGEQREEAVERCARSLDEALDIEQGPVIAFGIVRSEAGDRTTLVVVAHHLVMDGVSLRLIAEDFERAYGCARRAEPIGLPLRTAAPGAWAASLEEAVRAGRFDEDLAHWRRFAQGRAPGLPLSGSGSHPAEGTTSHVEIELDEGRTRDLFDASAASGRRMEQTLLAAVTLACARWTGASSIDVELEGHGRDILTDLDVTRTVGWFTRTHPVRVEGVDPSDAAATLEAVDRATRTAAGTAFLALRHLSPDPHVRDMLANLGSPPISFNYMGRFDAVTNSGLYDRMREPRGPRRSTRARRTHPIEIDAIVTGGRLTVRWSYSSSQIDAALAERLAAHTREALDRLAPPHPAPAGEIEDALPLSPMQEGMLFHHLSEEGPDPYVGQIALDLAGEINPDLLARAWQAAVDAHPALRTEFSWERDDRPVRIVRKDVTLPIVAHESEPSRLDEIMAEARREGFDVTRAPLARVDLVRTGERTATAIFTHHHLLLDGWSLPFVLEAVFEAYEAGLSGRPVRIRPAPSTRSLSEWMTSRDLAAAETFFRGFLAGVSSTTPAPEACSRREGVAREGGGSERGGVIHAAAPDGVEKRARSLGLTPSTVVQAAWALVLAACAGRSDVVFGATSSGRPPDVEGIESAVGLFINTLPVRVRVDPAAPARAWMMEIQRFGAEIRQHEQAPLAVVQRCAELPPNTPLFETLLVFENYPIDVAALRRRQGFEVTGVLLHEETNYPLTIVAAAEDALGFRAIYDRSLYQEEDVRLVLDRLRAAMEALLSRPDAPLREISVLPEEERALVTERFNDTRRDYPGHATITQLFESIARRRASEIALLFDGGSRTYEALLEGSLACARALRERGVGLESRVGLRLDRSPEFVAAVLGVLRAGAAYVPLDPESPPARSARMLESAGVTHVVSDDRRPDPDGPFEIVSFEDLMASGRASREPLPDVAGPENLAYVMFTSGSTGEPKGTEVSHRNIARLVLGADYARFGPGETTLLFSSIAFDVATFEIFAALLHGGRIAIPPPGGLSPAEIAGILERFGVTTLWLTSGLFQVMVDEEIEALARVPQVLAGGDVLSAPHVRRLLDAGCRRVINGYGPTETTTFAVCGGLSPGDAIGARVPIGHPIANTRVYVLDESGRPVPIGAAGKLFIGGDGVARGYSHRPDLTAERFVPDPFGPPGARLYDTGDVVSWRADGSLEFLGRRDRQVKVRGFRVELDDVEAALSSTPGVRSAAVVARREGTVVELAGYVVAGDEARDAIALRRSLAERVPGYMIPSRLTFLDAMPLNASGKIDRRALPVLPPEGAHRPDERAMSATEEAVAGIWRSVLELDRVGLRDDFFEIGGHSLHATRVVARLRRALGVELSLRSLFEAPTVQLLAERVEAERRGAASSIPRASEEERRKTSYAQQRLWFLDRLEPGSAAYNIASALRMVGPLDVEALRGALSAIVGRHEALRTRFEEGRDGPLQIVDPPAPLAIPLDDLSGLPPPEREAEVVRRAGVTAREPFDLEHGPLLRARLMRLDAEDHVLALCVHHIAADGWSVGVIVDELAAGYASFARGEEPRLAELPIQYADWAAWQRAWLDGGEMERQVAWWRDALEGLEPLALPTDRPRPAHPTYAGASLPVRLDPGLVERIERTAHAEGATLHMALLAVFAAVLARWSGQDDLGIGTPVANRTREEAESLIGFFVNTLVVRAPVRHGRMTYRELLGRIREAALGAYAHQDVPFERVVEALQPERDLTRTPLFQAMFILQNAPVGRLDLGGLRLSRFEAPTGTSTFDLTLSLEPPPPEAGEAGGLEGTLEYSTELFDETTMNRLWDHVVRLLEAVAGDPEADVRRIPLAGPEERDLALEQWSGRRALIARARPVHERFGEIAAADPGRLAAVIADRRVTYGELRGRAGRLAALLAGRGVGPETRVGLCAERSPELLAGMMAVLEAGGAFVPLDPDHPRDRLAFALEDSSVDVVLATRAGAAALGDAADRTLDIIPIDGAHPDTEPAPARWIGPEQLAYVIYTSGTTGRPKGVMVSHGALAAAYAAWETLYGLDRIRIHLQMAGVAFDVCTGDAVRALCSGGTLIICERERLLDPARLLELARRETIEFAEFVPAVLRQLALHVRDHGERLDSARIVAVGSDVWTTAELDAFRAVFGPRARLANSYGVTEATIDSTCWFADAGDAVAASPPIGRPLAHATVYVLDENLDPAPPGVLGELYLGGPGVARGYSGRADQTADRFVPDPFEGHGARLYRTGDRARYRPDGNITFAGRADDQVKIRGLRIEPAEIEAAIAALETVSSCAVAARPDDSGVARLAAWVVEREAEAFDADEARRLLRERLPEAMIPSAFAVLESLPLTQNGKVDRRRLPAPDWGAARLDEPPGTPAEMAVAAAYADVLELERVGAHDDFFALGGHSLLATRVVSRLRAALGVEVPLRLLFEAPGVRDLAARLESLAGVPESAPAPAMGRAGEASRRRLSYAQQRLWFLDRLEPDSPAYNLPSSILLEGELDAGALERALTEVVRRHESLRTVYREGAAGPEQVVLPPRPIAIALEDLSDLDPDRRREASLDLARLEARRPFDLETGPVLRAQLQKLGPRSHALLVTVHHIAADGWSLVILVRELGAIYGAFASGGANPLPEMSFQYADWAAWQRTWLEGGALERQLSWWRSELEGLPPLVLPSDRPRPARRTYAGESIEMVLEPSLREGLERLARDQGATLHMALLAGYAAVLRRWSGQEDFAIGVPIANRRTAEAEPLIGFCVNTLAMRARLTGRGLTFRKLIGRLRETSLGAYANQDVPFERIVEDLQPERLHGHSPLLQVLFALQNFPVGEIEMPGLSYTYEEPETGISRFDLELFFGETPGGLEGLINFSSELFDRATIEAFVENLTAFLQAAVAEPDLPLIDLPALSREQLRRTLVDWNASRETYGDPLLVHSAFEECARSQPQAIAARLGEDRIAYGDLEERARRLARLLRRSDVGPEDRVAVCVDRSFEMLVALLGAIKAGAAYVPVDPHYPRDRIALILEDSGARAVLTLSALAGKLPLGGMRSILLDREMNASDLDEDRDPESVVSPDALVYTIYTSGSTGRPKGIGMTHRAISNLLSWQRRDSRSRGARRTLQFASLSFDVSFQEIFSTLTSGGEIVLVTEEERRDPPRLLRVIASSGIERVFVPFVALQQLAEAARSEGIYPESLKEIDTAGEQLRITPAIAAFFERLPDCRLVNHYGPSETHLVTTFALQGPPSGWPELPPIGRPIANAPVYLLDEAGQPVPRGATGEIHVGGAGLARGYHARPDLTAELFLPDPFGDEPGARLYRTGDLARFDATGRLEFLGRRDLQIKVRGYRVEPAEIEACLARHPAVRQAAVRAHEHAGGKRLAAFVVLEAGIEASPAELKEHLARILPDYMVPAAFVVLDALPLTPNGKVDRQALPEPDWELVSSRTSPRTPEEEIVCSILADVLEVGSVGPDDDFFELGGHSLLATQVISRVRKAFDVEVPLRTVFESPTAAGIAEASIEARGGAAVPPPVRPASSQERKDLSLPQRRLWFLDRLEPGSPVYNLPAALRLEGELDVDALALALEEIVRRHESLRTRYLDGRNGPEQVVDPPAMPGLQPEEVAPGAGGDAVSALRAILARETEKPFDLERGPILRTRLLRISPSEHVLSLVVHHIAADGWSLGILVRELGELYGSFKEGRESSLAPLSIQYADWAAWQRTWLDGGELERQLAWWKDSLAGAPPALELPADRARPSTPTWRGATLAMSLPADLRARLQEFARAEGATLHMVLLAGYAWTLMRHGGQREIVVGTPVANRRVKEAEDLLGFFVNTLAVRIDGQGRKLTFRDLLARVREACLGAYANQDVPFERVVEEIQPERALNRAPIFQTAFALQNARIERVDLPGLTMTPLEVDSGTSKFDLMLVLEEEAGSLSGAFEYSTDLYDRATIQGIADSLESVLRAALDAPGAPLALIRLASEEEESRILGSWSRSDTPIEAPLLLHRLVEEQVERTPAAPALAGQESTITYGRLEERSNRIANHLLSLGAGLEQRVALVLDRSPEAIVAMLGILKAGCAYVPIEPGEPTERMRRQLETSQARFLLTNDRFLGDIPIVAGVTIIAIDGRAGAIDASPADRPRIGVHPANLAYVVFTSGSTGEPKGVGVEHRQIASYVAAAVERLGIRPGWRFALMSTLAADLGLTSIHCALSTGGCLHVPPAELALDAQGMEAYVADRGIDCLKIVPSHLQALLSGAHPERVIPARLLVLGGEATPGARLSTLSGLRPECLVANHYGPSEATVGAVAGFPDVEDSTKSGVPLGRPLANARIHVLDEEGRPAKAGVAGEIFISGRGVARGYLNRPELTADRFVPDPFGLPGARMYRTGDRARWLRDGRLEFLGRDDAQIKVRGFRVEPGEVQAALERDPRVRAAAVIVKPDAAGGARLTAYVAARPRVAPTIHGLRRRVLPGGIALAELNRNETDYLHREIVELGAYVRHGVTLRDHDTIFDVGANIGLFTVFASLACASPRVVAIEPNPGVLPMLRANAAAYAPGTEILDFALGEREGRGTFTFFEGFSLLSGLHADARTEKEVVKSFLENQARAGVAGAAELSRDVDALLEQRFRGRTLDVRLRPLSEVIAEHGVSRIDLLKINAEKAELEVLRGLGESDWPLISQAVVEVDRAAHLAPIVSLFESHGFEVLVDQDPLLRRTDLLYVYAARRGSGRRLERGAPPSVRIPGIDEPLLTTEALRALAARELPGPMQPSAWVIMESLPVTPNGKLDRTRLPEPEAPSTHVAPRGELERAIAGIWAEALGLPGVGAHDNFFDLGGHSLLLTMVHARLREALAADVSVIDLFRYPTVASLAERLAGRTEESGDGAHRARGRRRREATRARARSSDRRTTGRSATSSFIRRRS